MLYVHIMFVDIPSDSSNTTNGSAKTEQQRRRYQCQVTVSTADWNAMLRTDQDGGTAARLHGHRRRYSVRTSAGYDHRAMRVCLTAESHRDERVLPQDDALRYVTISFTLDTAAVTTARNNVSGRPGDIFVLREN